MAEPENAPRASRFSRFFSWLARSIQQPGWRRWVVFAGAVALFVILVAFLRRGSDFRRDPSILIPRDIGVYLETRNLGELLKHAAESTLWNEDRRASEEEQWNHLQAFFSGLIGDQVHGLGSRLPLSWFGSSRRAAFAWMDGEDDLPETWALYLDVPYPVGALAELRSEPGIKLETQNETPNFFLVSGNDERPLTVRAFGSWLIIASDAALPLYAEESANRPSHSLSLSGLLPEWRDKTSIRGVLNPSETARRFLGKTPLAPIAVWMRDSARCQLSAALDASGAIETRLAPVEMPPAAPANVIWSFLKLVLWILAVLCLFVAVTVLLVMLGWGAWFKALMVWAGITPAGEPAKVDPSAAFREDAGAPDAQIEEKEEMEEEPASDDGAEMATAIDYGEELEGTEEPVETFPEIQDEPPAPEVGHLPPAGEKPDASIDAEKLKPSPKRAATKPRLRRNPPKKKATNADSGTASTPKPRRRPPRRKSDS